MSHDITHCSNERCKEKAWCLRWQAYQEYFSKKYDGDYVSVFRPETETVCEYFIKNKEDESMDSKR